MDSCGHRSIRPLASLICAALLTCTPALAQDAALQTPCPSGRSGRTPEAPCSIRFFQLKNAAQQNDANEIMVALRNMVDPTVKIYLVNSDNTIVMEASEEQLDLAQRLITELDRPHKLYRLNFTLADLESGKTVGVRHAAMMVTAGQRVTLKQGNKVPVTTRIYEANGTTPIRVQSDNMDVGLTLDATITEAGNGLSLKSKVEESSLAADPTSAPSQNPAVHQVVLEGTSSVPLGKTVNLGTMDLPDSNHRLQIEVTAEPAS